jgi:hypothetical protein
VNEPSGGCRLYVIDWHRPVEAVQAGMGMHLLLETLHELKQPFEVGLVACGGASDPTEAAVVIRAPTEDLADQAAASFALAAVSVVGWLGLVPATIEQKDRLLGASPATIGYSFRVKGVRAAPVASLASPFWAALARAPGRWRVTVSVGNEVEGDDVDGTDPRIGCGLAIAGEGNEGPLLAALLAVDVAPTLRLEPVLARGAELHRLVDLQRAGAAPLSLALGWPELGWLFCFPVRAQGRWRVLARSPIASEKVLDAVDEARPPHVWLSGGSGMGKTTLLEHILDRDIEAGRRVVVVDPHGDLAERAAARLEAHGVPLIVVDFGRDDPPGWNLSVPEDGVDVTTWASLLEGVVREMWPAMPEETFGPSFTKSIRLAFRILLEDPEGPLPLTKISALFNDAEFAEEVLARAPDRSLAAEWDLEVVNGILGHEHGGHNRMWLSSKLDPLIGDPTVAAIISQPSTFTLSSVVRDGLSLVANIPVSRLTPTGARMLGGVLVSRLWLLVSRLRPVDAPPIALYIDEWHRVPAPSLGSMLAEARKFNLRLRLANQNVAQLQSALLEAVVANTGAVISFRAGARDAALLAGSFPDLGPDDLRTLPDHWVAVASGGSSLVAPAPPPLPPVAGTRGALDRLGALLVEWSRLESTIEEINEAYGAERALLLAQVAGWIRELVWQHVPAKRAARQAPSEQQDGYSMVTIDLDW